MRHSYSGFIQHTLAAVMVLLATTTIAATAETPAPDFTLKSNSGENIRLSELRGEVVLINFWASWCAPCKMMEPHFKATAARMEPNLRFAKVNTEQAQQTAARYGIRSIPTVALFRNGREVARQAGAMDARALTNWIESQL